MGIRRFGQIRNKAIRITYQPKFTILFHAIYYYFSLAVFTFPFLKSKHCTQADHKLGRLVNHHRHKLRFTPRLISVSQISRKSMISSLELFTSKIKEYWELSYHSWVVGLTRIEKSEVEVCDLVFILVSVYNEVSLGFSFFISSKNLVKLQNIHATSQLNQPHFRMITVGDIDTQYSYWAKTRCYIIPYSDKPDVSAVSTSSENERNYSINAEVNGKSVVKIAARYWYVLVT